MKNYKIILIVMLMAVASLVHAQNANEFTIPLSDPSKRGMLKAYLKYGSITVKGTARKDVLVKYNTAKPERANRDNDGDDEGDDEDDDDKKRRVKSIVKVDVNVKVDGQGKKSGEDPSKDGLKKISGSGLQLDASENGNLVKVGSDSWNARTNLEIEVPSGMDVKISAYNDGDIILSNVQGEVELTNYNGPITALNITGSVIATTYNGTIKVTFDKVDGEKPMSYSTYNGDIDLTFPAATKAIFKMKTERGDIYTGFEMNITSSGPVKQQDKSGGYKMKIDEWKRGDINGGGPEFTLKNYNGDIYIRKK
ncbi:MAG: DUF4097 family beta strand repeat protein [Cyclobacteriaceae bacterium]|nr:DUF4097 family beta strand repeat protein [Cyclobacteriaceae bacterium]